MGGSLIFTVAPQRGPLLILIYIARNPSGWVTKTEKGEKYFYFAHMWLMSPCLWELEEPYRRDERNICQKFNAAN